MKADSSVEQKEIHTRWQLKEDALSLARTLISSETTNFLVSGRESAARLEMRHEYESVWIRNTLTATLYDVSLPAINQPLEAHSERQRTG